jgi:F0F1-type ATP synthase membrane subunit b/b'
MIWFEYKFISSLEIFKNVKIITEYSALDFLLLVAWLVLIILLIVYVIPVFEIYSNYSAEISRKKKNAKMLKKMLLQKDIENEITNEIVNT